MRQRRRIKLGSARKGADHPPLRQGQPASRDMVAELRCHGLAGPQQGDGQ